MLHASHSQAYQELLTLLHELQNSNALKETTGDINSCQKEFQKLQKFFQEEILSLTSEELDEAIASRWQSLQTEMQREFRLLSTDILFLESSRQPGTREARLKSVGDRLTKLISFCQAIAFL
jgi:hypothetical protein